MHPELLDLLGLAPQPVATLHGVVTEAYLADLLGISPPTDSEPSLETAW